MSTTHPIPDGSAPTCCAAESHAISRGRPARGLVAFNLALLLVLGAVTIIGSLEAGAQSGGAGAGAGATGARPTPRARGDYTMVSGRYQGGTSNAIYVLDAANGELLALSWDRGRNELEIIGHRRIADDAQIKSGR